MYYRPQVNLLSYSPKSEFIYPDEMLTWNEGQYVEKKIVTDMGVECLLGFKLLWLLL